MSKQQKDESLNLEGRLHDGWALALRLKDGSVVRVCDHDSPSSVWARIVGARKAVADAEVEFSGCRAEAGGRIDGWAILPVSDVVGVQNFGPSLLGAGAVEARIEDLESGQENLEALVKAVVDRVNEIEGDLDAGEVEGEEAAPEVSPETKAALAAADDEDEG